MPIPFCLDAKDKYVICAVNTLKINLEDMIWYAISKSGGRLNKKDGLTRYGNSHVKDKTS